MAHMRQTKNPKGGSIRVLIRKANGTAQHYWITPQEAKEVSQSNQRSHQFTRDARDTLATIPHLSDQHLETIIETVSSHRTKADWDKFETLATEWLTEKYGSEAKFTRVGASNSTVSDILVEPKNGEPFHIEVKLTPAQSGQFTVKKNSKTGKLVVSSKTKKESAATQKIMDELNRNPDTYSSVDTDGVPVPIDRKLMSEWIREHYQGKNAKYFCFNTKEDKPLLLTAEQLDNLVENDVINMSAVCRAKRSGTQTVGKTRQADTLAAMRNAGWNQTISLSEKKSSSSASHRIMVSEEDVTRMGVPPKEPFEINGEEYLVGGETRNVNGVAMRELRRRSSTKTPTVIFSLSIDYEKLARINPSEIAQPEKIV